MDNLKIHSFSPIQEILILIIIIGEDKMNLKVSNKELEGVMKVGVRNKYGTYKIGE
ncbi:TPA: hypothetical protein RMI67_006625 [Bacillus cereus]|nr:hypothetical protein [Bacillus cereus]